jgi:hypothetical protein
MNSRPATPLLNEYSRTAACLGMLVLIGLISCSQRISMRTLETGPIPASSDWRSVPLSEPLNAKWDVQAIYVNIETKHESSVTPLGISLGGGSTIAPEIELVDRTGQIAPFRFVGFSNSDLVFQNDHIARGSSFSELRIRSPQPLVCSQMRWISYMPKDTKTGVP